MNNIKLLLVDVDGTLTDGKIIIDNNGVESKNFNVKDGLAIAQAIKYGLKIIIITGRNSTIVQKRANELGVENIFQNIADKKTKVLELIEFEDITLEEIAYIGDDINDLAIMNIVGFKACPADAAAEIKEISDFISSKNGGEGAVREIIEHMLKEMKLWEKIVSNYTGLMQ